jgi:hypothetical protein
MPRKRTKFIVLFGLALVGTGCELLVEFDRTLIDAGADGSTVDVTTQDQSTNDVSNDISNDVVMGNEAGMDAADADTGTTTSDASDASEASTIDDAGNDADGE